jgi:two-component system, sensor histidine kinase FlrB
MQQSKSRQWNTEQDRLDSLPDASVARVLGGSAAKADVRALFADEHLLADSFSSDSAEGQPVEQALSLFDHLSSQLTSSYRDLEQKVHKLKHDLSEEELHRQEQLREKEAIATRMETLLEILPAGVVLLDGKGCVSECNPAAIDLLGEPLEGQLWLDVIKRCFAPKHDDGHEVSLKDGRRVRIETRSMTAETGQLILLSDLTETRLLQEKVSRTERLGSLGKMVASLAHQIRTPLSTAMLYAGHLSQAGISDKMRQDCANKLLSRLTHLEHQIRDMLIFAKGETRMAEELSIERFEEALRAAIEPVIEKSNIDCEWDVSAFDRSLLCNREALVGACLNLVNNSIEAFEQSGIKDRSLELKIALENVSESGVSLSIRDNGPGIPKVHQSKLFEPFFTTKPQGTGLGLAVVQAVVKAHKGVFTLDSSKQGVTSVITLPTRSPSKRASPAIGK